VKKLNPSTRPFPEQLYSFLDCVRDEVFRAREKFPSSECSMTALTEEVGELAKAHLDEPWAHVMKEAIQVACMAARVAIEGDPTIANYRNRRRISKAKGGAA
jgi:hypothetical protein